MLKAGKVNYIWNYCNNLTIGTSKILKIHSEIVNAVNEEYAKKRLQSKKPYLKFRTNKKIEIYLGYHLNHAV